MLGSLVICRSRKLIVLFISCVGENVRLGCSLFILLRIVTGEMSFVLYIIKIGPPLWSSGQTFWLQIQRSRVRFPAVPDFLSSCGSGMGSTQPREVN